MASKKYLMFDLDDQKLSLLTDVLSNKTSKRILEYLADKEASETEVSRDLKLPANTVNYNIKKLVEAGLIHQTKDFFWSIKGKKILKYRISNKKIIISPMVKNSRNVLSILGAAVLTAAAAFVVKIYSSNNLAYLRDSYDSSSGSLGIGVGETSIAGEKIAEVVPTVSNEMINNAAKMSPEIWVWFLAGGIFALIIFMILNWRRL